MKNLEIKEVSAEELNDGTSMTAGVISGVVAASMIVAIGIAIT